MWDVYPTGGRVTPGTLYHTLTRSTPFSLHPPETNADLR